MGKSVSPYSHVIDRLEALFAPYRRALRREDQQRLDRLFTYARKHTPSGVALADPDPWRPVMLSILLELLRRLDELDESHDDPARRGHPL